MKKLMLLISTIVVAVCVASPLGAMFSRAGYTKIKDDRSGPGVFEIVNKVKKPFYLTLINGDEFKVEKKEVTLNEPYQAHIDINKPTELYIWSDESKVSGVYAESPEYQVTFTPGKDIILSCAFVKTYRQDILKLNPQSGKFKGLLSKSVLGNDLRNNVTQNDINIKTEYESWRGGWESEEADE